MALKIYIIFWILLLILLHSIADMNFSKTKKEIDRHSSYKFRLHWITFVHFKTDIYWNFYNLKISLMRFSVRENVFLFFLQLPSITSLCKIKQIDKKENVII